MRFQATTSREHWYGIFCNGILVAFSLLGLFQPHFRLPYALGLFFALVALLLMCHAVFARFWQMDENGLRQRIIPWINVKIKWQDVTRIESSWTAGFNLKIEYKLPSGRVGQIWPISIADEEAFLAELHRFAPYAELTKKSSGNVLSIIS